MIGASVVTELAIGAIYYGSGCITAHARIGFACDVC
jgi:hypothetical protein